MADVTAKNNRFSSLPLRRITEGVLVIAGLSAAAMVIRPQRLPLVMLMLALAYLVGALGWRRGQIQEARPEDNKGSEKSTVEDVNSDLADLKSKLDHAAKDKMLTLVKRNHELMALYSLANVVGSSLDLSEVLGVALDGVIKIFGAQAGEIDIIGEPEETLIRFSGKGNLKEHRGGDAPRLNRTLSAKSARTGLPMVVEAASGLRYKSLGSSPPRGISQFASFPVKAKSRTLGVITLALAAERQIISTSDRELLMSVGSMIGTAIENGQLYQRLKRISDTDPITGLYNHRFIMKRLNGEIRRASRYGHSLSIMMLDVDNFKDLNDIFGHPFGDVALKKIAMATVTACRDTDFVGRYGGDEFLLVLPETKKDAAVHVGERVRTYVGNLSLTPLAREKAINVNPTVSLGLAVYPGCGKTGSDMIISADRNLYFSKRSGGDQMNFRRAA